MILIDHKDRRPIYEQIIERFQQMILCGALQPGASMPSVRSLAMELSLKGKGSFVSETATAAANKRRQLRRELQAFTDKALLAGISAQELQGMLAECIQSSSVSTNKMGDEKYDNSDQC